MGRRGDHTRQRLRAQLIGRLPAGENDGARAVVQRRGVARGHLGCVRLCRERGELLGRGVVANRLVVLEGARRQLARRRDLDRVDLLAEATGVTGGRRVPVRAKREGVDLLARELVAIGDVLRRLHHLDVGVAGK